MLDMTPEDEKPAADPANPLKRTDAPMIVHENEPAPDVSTMTNPADPTHLLETHRIIDTFTNMRLGDVLVELVADTGIKLYAEPGPLLSQIRFDDEPLRVCLDRLAHLVSGSYEFGKGELHFKAGS